MSSPANTCRVGILIPVYNGAATIAETVESIQQQDGLGELTGVYLADNASADDTVNIARAAWKAPLALTVLPNSQNAGQAVNTNRAFRELSDRLDWVLILHADDTAKPQWLRTMLDHIHNASGKVASICSSYDDIRPDGIILPGEDEPDLEPEVICGSTAQVRRTLLEGCWWHISGCAIRVQAFRKVGDVSLNLPNRFDWEWLVRCQKHGWDIEYIPRALVFYRDHPASTSAACLNESLDIRDVLQVVNEHRDALRPTDWLWIHGRLLACCARRVVKASLRADGARIARCSRAAAMVASSCVGNTAPVRRL